MRQVCALVVCVQHLAKAVRVAGGGVRCLSSPFCLSPLRARLEALLARRWRNRPHRSRLRPARLGRG